MKKRLSLIIPTRNRPAFIERLLRYYSQFNCPFKLIIFEDAEPHFASLTQKHIDMYNSLDVHYETKPINPDSPSQACSSIVNASKLIDTPYAMLNCDDDLFVPGTLVNCMDFLDHHKDYVSAHGKGVKFKLYQPGPYGRFICCMNYPIPSTDLETPAQRVDYLLRNYGVSQFCVNRSDVYKKLFLFRTGDKQFDDEIIPCLLSFMYGKSKELDELFIFRQYHQERYLVEPFRSWVDGKMFPEIYDLFLHVMVEKLLEVEPMEYQKAVALVNDGFKVYRDKYYNSVAIDVQQKLSRIPGVRYVLRTAKDMMLYRHGYFSLDALLNNSSSYHEDFMKAYDVIRGGVK